MERIFTPFFTTKPEGVGTGLGLPICREIIDAHGGSLKAESYGATGSTFVLRLPPCARGSARSPENDRLAPREPRG